MDEIIVEGVRCFYERQSIPLRKLTVLVGENSSGKSTFLALTRIAWRIGQGAKNINFNEEPFRLGAFEQIASQIGRSSRRAKSFTIGFRVRTRKGFRVPLEICGTFLKSNAQPQLGRWTVEQGQKRFAIDFLDEKGLPKWSFTTPGGSASLTGPARYSRDAILFLMGIEYPLDGESVEVHAGEVPSEKDFEAFRNLMFRLERVLAGVPYAFAPIRTQPQRTYDPLTETPEPQGSHVPMALARISSSDWTAWKALSRSLREFGKASGLFAGVEVRRMGKGVGDPFQVRISFSGSAFNLVDVGYGVSQILPIIVDILRSEGERLFLLQQPEVHLHPRAQAELGSFLATLATTTGKRFVVETHSDYLVDRIRMDIRDGRNIKPEDVMILYFERQNGKVKVHPIEIDENGNLESVPKGYRSFFLEEERRFLGG